VVTALNSKTELFSIYVKDSRKSYKYKVISVLFKCYSDMYVYICYKKWCDIVELNCRNNKKEN